MGRPAYYQGVRLGVSGGGVAWCVLYPSIPLSRLGKPARAGNVKLRLKVGKCGRFHTGNGKVLGWT